MESITASRSVIKGNATRVTSSSKYLVTVARRQKRFFAATSLTLVDKSVAKNLIVVHTFVKSLVTRVHAFLVRETQARSFSAPVATKGLKTCLATNESTAPTKYQHVTTCARSSYLVVCISVSRSVTRMIAWYAKRL